VRATCAAILVDLADYSPDVGARSGTEYLQSIRRNRPEVWLGGKRVEDVTTEPVFAGPLATTMEQYDLQLDARYRDFATTDGYSSSFSSGGRVIATTDPITQ
jgi:aromatic ring hydroxylase